MDQPQILQVLLSVLFTQSPLLLTYLVGITIALVRWNKHPWVSALASIGCGLLFFEGIAFSTFAGILPSLLLDRGWTGPELGGAFNTLNVLRCMVSSLGIGCLLAAAFGRRQVGQASA